MSIEIKFRAWYEKDKQMIDWLTLTQSAWNTFRGETPLSLIYDILVARKPEFNVMQFTDLKDKNGKTYCQDDIVKYGEKQYRLILGTFKFELVGWEHDCFFEEGKYRYGEIIGNIHQDKELISQRT